MAYKETLAAALVALLIVGGALYFLSPHATQVKVGWGARDLEVPLLDSPKHIQVGHLRGLPLILFFFRSNERWSEGQISQLQKTFLDFGPSGLRILAVSFDEDPSLTERLVKKYGVTFSVGTDPGGVKTRTVYATTDLPEAYLVEQSGRVRKIFPGPVAWLDPAVREEIVASLPLGAARRVR